MIAGLVAAALAVGLLCGIGGFVAGVGFDRFGGRDGGISRDRGDMPGWGPRDDNGNGPDNPPGWRRDGRPNRPGRPPVPPGPSAPAAPSTAPSASASASASPTA